MRDKALVLTVVNPSVSETRVAEINVRSANISSGTVTVLTHSDIHAHNSFELRDAVRPQTPALEIRGGPVTGTFRPASVSKMVLNL